MTPKEQLLLKILTLLITFCCVYQMVTVATSDVFLSLIPTWHNTLQHPTLLLTTIFVAVGFGVVCLYRITYYLLAKNWPALKHLMYK